MHFHVLTLVLCSCSPADAGWLALTTCAMLHGLQDDEMWIRLSLFFSRLPARAFFDGPTNTSNDGLRGRTLRSLFPVSAARCDAQLTAAYAAAGSDFSSTLQTRTLEGWPVFGEARDEVFVAKVGLVSRADSATAAVPLHAATRARRLIGSRTLREFQQCALAFSCGACGEPGAAMRQCAACAALLCFECCVRCADDEPDRLIEGGRGYVFQRAATGRSKRCAFALCRSCDASLSLRRVDGAAPIHRDDLFDMPAPGLSAPLCSGCASRPDPWWARERARCLAHVNACICYCAKWDTCHEEMCTHDCDGSPSLLNCHKSFTFISSFACGDANQRHLGLCSKPSCPGCYCSECYPALTCL